MKNYVFTLLFFAGLCNVLNAQSYYFSQFYSTPLLVNPANTGFTASPYRFATNFRNQGMNGGGFTGYLSADLSLMRNKLSEGNKLGVGIYLMNDQSLNGALQTNSMGFSAASTVVLDEDGYQSVGVGLQGTYNQRVLDYRSLRFESQFQPDGAFNPDPGGLDVPQYSNKKYIDANAGIMYHANLENQCFFAGFAWYNIVKHKENMLPEEFRIPTRFTLQAGGRLDISSTESIYFSIINTRQSKASELTAGVSWGYLLSEDARKEINFGLWYRYRDAFIPYIGYKINGIKIGFTYDHTISNLKAASQIKNGYELTLLFCAPDRRELKRLIPWY